MTYLLLGLVVFLGVHSVRIFAAGWRERVVKRHGQAAYKGVYSVLSLVGFCLIVWGFGQAREVPVLLWQPSGAMRHVTALLMLLAFVLLAATYVPANAIKARVHHPMVLAVKTWAFAHLLSTGTVAHAVLFGAFLVWAVVLFVVSRRHDRRSALQSNAALYPRPTRSGTIATVVVGVAAWALVAFSLHGMLIGIRPLG